MKFDLEQAIAAWRQRMLAVGITAPVPMGELEEHLREEIERLVESGMEPEAAMWFAVEKMGRVQELKTEFAKIDHNKGLREQIQIQFAVGIVLLCISIIPIFVEKMGAAGQAASVAIIASAGLAYLRVNTWPWKATFLGSWIFFTLIGTGMNLISFALVCHFHHLVGVPEKVLVFWGVIVTVTGVGTTFLPSKEPESHAEKTSESSRQ